MIILSLVLAIGAVGLNVIMGFGGYISLGQSAFIGLGAYTVGIATTQDRRRPVRLGARSPASSRRCSRPCSG